MVKRLSCLESLALNTRHVSNALLLKQWSCPRDGDRSGLCCQKVSHGLPTMGSSDRYNQRCSEWRVGQMQNPYREATKGTQGLNDYL